jgi:hypothetical protein
MSNSLQTLPRYNHKKQFWEGIPCVNVAFVWFLSSWLRRF